MIRASQPPAYGPPLPPPTAYGRPFWMAFAANLLIMVAVSLLFRYADFIVLLGGTELHLGWIVGVGMVGSLAMRLTLGSAIDRYGPRVVWLGSVWLFVLSSLAHVAIADCHGPAVYLVRIAWCCSLAGIFGAAMTFISYRAPVERMAEMVGMLGTSGFVGMVLGTQLGDLMLGTEEIGRQQVDRMFLAAGMLGTAASLFVYLATLGQRRPAPARRAPLIKLLRSHFPGMVILVGIAMGIGLSLPATFLRTYTAKIGISEMAMFFHIYAAAAIVTRVLTRRLPERLGTTPMILIGVAMLALSQVLFLLVDTEWKLIIPGISYGVGHAILFPSVVAAGSRSFPPQHRGLATTLLLGTWDTGTLIGAPMAGAVLHYSAGFGLPPYPTMFMLMACLLGSIGLIYALLRRTSRRPAVAGPHEDHTTPTPEEALISARTD